MSISIYEDEEGYEESRPSDNSRTERTKIAWRLIVLDHDIVYCISSYGIASSLIVLVKIEEIGPENAGLLMWRYTSLSL